VSIVDMAWRSKGACHGLDAEMFYPDNEDHADFALSVCEQCEVRIACLNYALDNREHQAFGAGQPLASVVAYCANVARARKSLSHLRSMQ